MGWALATWALQHDQCRDLSASPYGRQGFFLFSYHFFSLSRLPTSEIRDKSVNLYQLKQKTLANPTIILNPQKKGCPQKKKKKKKKKIGCRQDYNRKPWPAATRDISHILALILMLIE